jgi:hypothetical protein
VRHLEVYLRRGNGEERWLFIGERAARRVA